MRFLKLGRWCHPTSEYYKNSCDQLYKMALANSDSCSAHKLISTKKLTFEKSNLKSDNVVQKQPRGGYSLSQLLASYYR